MRKVFLSLVAVLLCGVTFAQTVEINDADDFLAIDGTKNYVQTADIILGDLGDKETAIIASLSSGKTYDGGNFTITYSANFTAGNNAKIGLFGTNNGTIKNLNLDADITVGGNGTKVNTGLLCGENTTTGTIEFCDVTGNINSTTNSTNTGISSTGLIIGSNLGDLKYSTGHGNVTGVGYVGGLVGSMGTVNMPGFLQFSTEIPSDATPLIYGCYFTGNVTANESDSWGAGILQWIRTDIKAFGGGICGFAVNPAEIKSCVAEAIIVVAKNAGGITNSANVNAVGFNLPDASNNYCTGTLNETTITDQFINYVRVGGSGNNTGTNNYSDASQATVNALNTAKGNDNNFYFALINGKVVLIVRAPEAEVICETPTAVTVVKNGNKYVAEWHITTSLTGKVFNYTLSGGALNQIQTGTVENALSQNLGPLTASTNPYTFKVKQNCESSSEVSYTFYVNAVCTPVSALQATNITTTSANITWTGEANEIKVNDETVAFTQQGTLALNNLTPATTYIVEAIVNCSQNGNTTSLPTTISFTTLNATFETAQSGNFNTGSTWVGGKTPQGDIANITINEGHKVSVNHNLVITDNYKINTNNGVLQITQAGQLINTTSNNVTGIVEIVSGNKTMNAWTFIGAPFANGYTLGAVKPVSEDVAMVRYDYTEGKWKDNWAHVGNTMEAGEGVFAWPFYGGAITFSTYNFGASTSSTYPENATATYALNNGNFTVSETITPSSNGKWMALANPYPAKLSITKFLDANTFANSSVSSPSIQGEGVYIFNGTSFDYKKTGDILMTEGFFVNFVDEGSNSVAFNKNQLTNWNGNAKSSANEFIELTLQNGDDKVRVYFAHNEDAEQGYDIFDANKMFATTGVAEPYFVTDGIALIKEEVAELPYYATMNVRSQQDTVMNFVLTNLPEGYAVSIIDGEEVIDLVEGGVYSTEILTGENADRFKVLVKKNVGLADVEELDVTIINSNRHISITAQEDVKVTVYNTLGQRVFETEKTDFVLSGVASGAYVVKVQGAKAAKSQKIIVE